MVDRQEQKIPIVILTGKGTRIGPTLEQASRGLIPVEIVAVVTHKALPKDLNRMELDLPGIALAQKLEFRTELFNLTQMTLEEQELAKRKNREFDPKNFRENFYFPALGLYLRQRWPVKPVAVFMNGWDLVVPQGFMDYFPGNGPDGHNVINYHPSLLPRKRGEQFVTLKDGKTQIPVLIGEETDVFEEALRLELPAIGATMHYAQIDPDVGGTVIETVEVPIHPGDDYDSLRERHIKVESEFMADAIGKWVRQQLTN